MEFFYIKIHLLTDMFTEYIDVCFAKGNQHFSQFCHWISCIQVPLMQGPLRNTHLGLVEVLAMSSE